MISTDPTIYEARKRAIANLLKKRKELEAVAASLMASPSSYGITGSVNVTNRDADSVRAEIAEIDLQIKQLLVGGGTGFSLSYPNYRWRWCL